MEYLKSKSEEKNRPKYCQQQKIFKNELDLQVWHD